MIITIFNRQDAPGFPPHPQMSTEGESWATPQYSLPILHKTREKAGAEVRRNRKSALEPVSPVDVARRSRFSVAQVTPSARRTPFIFLLELCCWFSERGS